MIGWLRGTVVEKRPPFLILDVQGVGYEVEATLSTFYQLPDGDRPVTLFTHLVVRDDAHLLYGFANAGERDLFRMLIRINGVGPKLALSVLSGMNAETFLRCVAEQDVAALTRLPGVGRKTAERLVMEMKDRVEGVFTPAGAVAQADPLSDAVSALVALGYKPQDAARMARSVQGEDLPSEEIIRRALKAAMKA